MKTRFKQLYRNSFLDFSDKALRHLEGIKIRDQLYVALICSRLEKTIRGETTRFSLNAPPRHLKTLLCAVCLAAYELGLNPKISILIVCYNDMLAKEIADKVREILRSKWFQEVFPATLIKLDHSRSGDFQTTKGGGVRAISIHSRNPIEMSGEFLQFCPFRGWRL